MVDCIICGKKLEQHKYDFGENRTFCIDCMSCSVCGSKATGERRGIIGIQPFCNTHFEEAKVEMAKPVEEWSDKFVEANLNHLKKLREHAVEIQNKAMQRGKLAWLGIFGDPTIGLRTDVIRGQNYQVIKDAIESIDKKIISLEQILIKRRETTSDLTRASQDPIMILKIRFAKGEITREEYEEMLKTLTDA